MSLSSIALIFGELTEVIDKWRKDTVKVASLGFPPHVTLLYPWRDAPLKDSDIKQLERVLEPAKPFEVCFNQLSTFEAGVVYLALENEQPVKHLMKALFTAFPDTPPYRGAFPDPSPHLTIAECNPEDTPHLVNEISKELSLPFQFNVREVVVMEEDQDGQWFNRHIIQL